MRDLFRAALLASAIILATFVTAACASAQAADNASADPIAKEWLRAPADPLSYYDRYEQAIRLYYADKHAEAEPLFQSLVRDYPQDGLVWLYLGLTEQELHKPKEAVEALKRAGTLHTKVASWFVDYALAGSYLELKDKENAYRALEELVNGEHFLSRQRLYNMKAFAAIKDEPRFRKLAGHVDASKLSRDEGWRRDIDLLLTEIKRVNPIYRNAPLPEEVLNRYKQLKKEVPKLSDEEIYLGMAGIAAALHQGHTGIVVLPESKTPIRMLALQSYSFPEGVYVIQ